MGMNENTISWLIPAVLLLSAPLCVADSPMDCVSEMTMPYVTGGMMMSIPATIQVRVTIGKKGVARTVDYGDAKPIVRNELDQYFKEKARYVPACEGRTISFTIRYLVEGMRTSHLVSEVRFRPPNVFVVVAHPIEPSLDPFPKDPRQQPGTK
jgi:hypothetical protein